MASKPPISQSFVRWIGIWLLVWTSLWATEYNPWLPPLWEFQGRLSYLYDKEKTVQSPNGNFPAPSIDSSVQGSLGLTFWPNWSAELEVFLTRTSDIPFSYEAAYGTIRYQWLNDVSCDYLSCVTGLTCSFPATRYLHDFSYTYHGEINLEGHLTIGKEWVNREEWWMRGWVFGGWGIANRGKGWVHGLAGLELKFCCIEWGIFLETVVGLGSNNIIPNVPFVGYALIDHRTLDLATTLSYDISCLGTLSCLGWYNAYARNFVLHSWGFGITLLIPFSV